MDASKQIDKRIAETTDWRGKVIAHLRQFLFASPRTPSCVSSKPRSFCLKFS